MAKQVILIILLSVGAIFFRTELSKVLDVLIYLHNNLSEALLRIFSSNDEGRLIQDIMALLLIPLIIGGIFGLILGLINRDMLHHTMLVIWIVWLVLLTTMIAQTGMQPVSAANGQPGAAGAVMKIEQPQEDQASQSGAPTDESSTDSRLDQSGPIPAPTSSVDQPAT